MVNQGDQHDHEGEHHIHNVNNEPFLESQSKAQVGVVVIGHPVQRVTNIFNRAPKFPVDGSQGKIAHFKTGLIMLKQRVRTTRDTTLQENRKFEELIRICDMSVSKLSSVEEHLKSLTRQWEEYNCEFQRSPLEEYIDKACSTTNPPLYIGEIMAELPKWIMLSVWLEQHEWGIEKHQHSRFVPCTIIHLSRGMNW